MAWLRNQYRIQKSYEDFMISFEKFKEEIRSRGVFDFTPLDYSFALMVAIGMSEADAYICSYKSKEYDKKTDKNRPDFISKCENEAKQKREDLSISKMVDFLKVLYDNQIKEQALNLGELVDLSSSDIKKITAKLLSDKACDMANSETKDIISAIKLYMDNFIDSTNDNERMFSRHFIEIHSPCNMVCTHCNHEFRILEGVSQKCPTCNHLYTWSNDEERFFD